MASTECLRQNCASAIQAPGRSGAIDPSLTRRFPVILRPGRPVSSTHRITKGCIRQVLVHGPVLRHRCGTAVRKAGQHRAWFKSRLAMAMCMTAASTACGRPSAAKCSTRACIDHILTMIAAILKDLIIHEERELFSQPIFARNKLFLQAAAHIRAHTAQQSKANR